MKKQGSYSEAYLSQKSNVPQVSALMANSVSDYRREKMAQEVEQVIPEAVITRPDGYKMVNYGVL